MGNKKTKLDSIRAEKRREKKAAQHQSKMNELRLKRITDPERIEKERQRKIRHYVDMNSKAVRMIAESVYFLQQLKYEGNIAGALTNHLTTEVKEENKNDS